MSPEALRRLFHAGKLSKPDYVTAMLEQHQALFEYADFLRDTDIAAIEIRAEGVLFRLRDLPFSMSCPRGEARVAPLEILNFAHYERAETSVLLPLVRSCRCILDVGANIGWFSLWFAHHASDAQIHAFEPMPQSLAFLDANVQRNGLAGRIHTHRLGLSEKAGEFEFFVYPAGATNVSLANVSGAPDATRVTAATERMDDWCARMSAVPDLIKCDVEGAELLVFRGGVRTLREVRPVVFTEMLRKWSRPFGYHPNDMIAFFASLDYRCLAIGADGARPFEQMTDESAETNFLFVPQEKVLPGLA